MSPAEDLWSCPECGHQFVTENTWHSCGHYLIDDHFQGKDQLVREIFDHLVEVVEGFGPLTIYAQKTRIVFQARTRFVSVVTRVRWLDLQIWLKRRADHTLLQRVEMYTYRDHGHIFRLSEIEDIDPALVTLLHEAYVIGSQ